MSKIALNGILTIDPKHLDAFMAELKDHAAKTLASEPGCLLFESHVSVDDAHQILLYEVYADADAIVAHRKNPQWVKWRAATDDMVTDRAVQEWEVI
jgi:autoinducer 2-degrading protein